MELPEPTENIHRLNDMYEAQERLRGQQETSSGEAGPTKFLTLVAAGFFITTIGLLWNSPFEPWYEVLWRIPVGVALLWIPLALCVMLFSGGTIPWKKALWMGAWPSLFGLVPLIALLLLMLDVVVIALPIKGAFWLYHLLRR